LEGGRELPNRVMTLHRKVKKRKGKVEKKVCNFSVQPKLEKHAEKRTSI